MHYSDTAGWLQDLLFHEKHNRRKFLIYLTASSNWLAMCFLLLEGVTQMALMPQTAATGSFSQMITLPSIISESLIFTGLFSTSL
jgi:hypothetical protein